MVSIVYLGGEENTAREIEKKKRERKAAQKKVFLWAKKDFRITWV